MKNIVLVLSALLLLACANDDVVSVPDPCVDNPAENVPWIKQLIDDASKVNDLGLEIVQYNYKGSAAFEVDDCINCADALTVIYDCEKNKICEVGGIAGVNTCNDFYKEATNPKVIFSTRINPSSNCEKNTIISNKLYNSLKASPISNAKISGNCLFITFSILSTQNRLDDVTLVDSGAILESNPIQRKLKFNLKENFTKPTSVIETVSFDISNLAAWNSDEIILNIAGYNEKLRYQRVPQCGDPNVLCEKETTIEEDSAQLEVSLKELQGLSESEACTDASEWKFTEVGSKPCGGPRSFLPYSIKIDVADFLKKVATYTLSEKAFNKKWGIVSTCEVILGPVGVKCEEEKAVLVFNN